MELNQFDLDWKNILIKKYLSYDLDELDVMVLFVSDQILVTENQVLLTSQILSTYMKAPIDTIDASLSKLMDKKYIVLQNEGTKFFCTMDSFKKLLFEDAMKDYSLKSKARAVDASDSFYTEIEKIASQTLTPTERDYISRWLSDGIEEDMIKEACRKCVSKSGNIMFHKADKMLLDMQRSQSRKNVGASTVNEDTRKNEELHDLFANTDWTYHGE